MRFGQFIRGAALALLASATVAVAVGRADARERHFRLVRAEPGVDSTVTQAPDTLRLWFSEKVDARVTTVRLRAADSSMVALGGVTAGATASEPVRVPLRAALKAGRYSVAWRSMGSDGHVVSGTYAFTLRAAAAAR